MLLDLLNSDNYININIDIAKIFGINAAVYCSELMNIYKKAITKCRLIDNEYFKLDRKYMTNRTTLTSEDQILVDSKFIAVGIMSKHADDPDIIKLDVNLLASIITSEDESTIKSIQSKIKPKKEKRKSTQETIISNMKNHIKCSNDELKAALYNWVDAIYAKPSNAFLTFAVIDMFQNSLYEYTKGDLDMALRLVEIATIQGFKDFTWVKSTYERDLRYNKKSSSYTDSKLPRTTAQKVATNDTIDKSIVF